MTGYNFSVFIHLISALILFDAQIVEYKIFGGDAARSQM